MSINGSDYQEPYVSLLEADNLASGQTTSPEKVFVKDKEEEEKPSRPYGIYLVGLTLVTILAILIFKNDSSPSYYFTYPELQYPKGREIVRSYYTKYYTDEMWILTEQFKSSISSLPLVDDQKNVVVFDLDETLIDNYRIIDEMDFGWDDVKYDAWVDSGLAPKIEPMFNFLQFLEAKNIKIAFITGRPESQREATVSNLANFGLVMNEDYVSLDLRSDSEKHLAAAEFKLNRRRELANTYRILACVGDQNSDCTGSFTGIPMKVPNYMYLIN